jgi:hypothetical protein
MIGELAKQLFIQSSSVPEELWTIFEKYSRINVEKAQQIFTLLSRRFESTYICIDALDECLPHTRSSLLRFFGTVQRSSLRIFCTGRTSVEAEVVELLEPLSTKTMEIYAHESDLRKHIEALVAVDRHKKAMDAQLLEEITKQLLSQSQKL